MLAKLAAWEAIQTLEGMLPTMKLDWGEELYPQLLLPWVFSYGTPREGTDGSRGSRVWLILTCPWAVLKQSSSAVPLGRESAFFTVPY